MRAKSLSLLSALVFVLVGMAASWAQETLPDPVIDSAATATSEFQPEITASAESDRSQVKDVILVLDNSGSMKSNDPDFLTSRAVREFIDGLDTSTRIAIIIFDQGVALSVPLTQISTVSRVEVLQSLDKINYQGLFTDSPAAIERAIYELKNNSRDDALKVIIFMTDGIVDTGDAAVDLEKGKWLKESLAPDAADADIQIFGIAFTEDADFQLIQSLAQTTGGEYYRALQAEDLRNVFEQINTIINQPPEEAVIAAPQVSQPSAPVQQAPVIIQVPAQPAQAMGKEERIRNIIIIVAVVVLITTLLVIMILLLRRSRSSGPGLTEIDTEAYLNDIHGYTEQASYKLSSKPTMLGRVAGKDTELLDYLVIPESTIGRRHSLIEYKDFSYWIIDQGSINGTFVNDHQISSEERLKHGDKVRLHKFEFEFVMPDMVDAGMTVVSNTVMAGQPSPAPAADATALKATMPGTDNSEDMDLDFDLTAGIAEEPDAFAGEELPADNGTDQIVPEQEFNSEDETFIPGMDTADPVDKASKPAPAGADSEDETLMPGGFDFPDEEATIRKENADEDLSLDNFIDLNDLDDDK